MTFSRLETPLALVVVVALVTTALAPTVLGDAGGTVDWPDGPTRLFYSDDPDVTDAGDAVTGEDTSLVNVTDLYYRSTEPTATADGMTLAEYRRQQLMSVDRSDDDSKYLPFSDLESGADAGDGPIIEDAHVTLLGVIGGGRPVMPGTDGPLYIPGDGQVLNYLDYRVDESEVPDDYTEDVNENVTKEHSYTFEGHQVGDRVVEVDGREVGRDDDRPGARVIDYDDASGSGTVSLTIRATISVQIEHEIVTIREVGNETETETDHDTIQREVTVSDTVDVHVVDDQAVEVRQRFVDVEGETEDRLLVTVDGPQSLADRQLWSTLAFEEPSMVVNNWGVYSTTQYTHGHVASEGGEYRYDFPHVLRVKFTSSFDEPYSDVNYSAGASASPSVVAVEQTNLTDEEPSLARDVNLTVTRPTVVHQFAVTDPPGEIETATGLFGRDVDVRTEPSLTVHEARLEVTKLGDGNARVRLYDPDTGDGLDGRTLSLSGAERGTATTNADGVVVVNRTERTLHVTFDGDDWREDIRTGELDPTRDYYGPAQDDLLVVEKGLLWTGLVDVAWAFLVASPFIIGWIWIRSMDTVL